MTDQTAQSRYDRRALLKGTAQTAGLVGAGAVAGVGGVGALTGSLASRPAAADEHEERNKYTVGVGELDEYYVFFSSGQCGEVRIVGPAVDARADAHPGLQPLQRHRLGSDQREPQDPDRGAAARDQ